MNLKTWHTERNVTGRKCFATAHGKEKYIKFIYGKEKIHSVCGIGTARGQRERDLLGQLEGGTRSDPYQATAARPIALWFFTQG